MKTILGVFTFAAMLIAGQAAYADKVLLIKRLHVDETTESGQDEVYLELYVDDVKHLLPSSGHHSMNEDSDIDTWYLNREFTFSDNVKLYAMEEDGGDDDVIGAMLESVSGKLELLGTQFTIPPTYNKSVVRGMDGDGGEYKLYYAIRDAPAQPDTFTMAVISDPQYGFCVVAFCKNTLESSENANTLHAKSIKALKGASNFFGVIINGDLTNTEDDHQLEAFQQDYASNFLIFPGLGNHDYQNYYKKYCTGPVTVHTSGFCTKEMLDYMVSVAQSNPHIKGFDYSSGKWDRTGSYSYYFDKGDYRFVQLQNHPAYTLDFSVYMSNRVGSEDFKITSSMQWLDDLLGRSQGKKVILNMHGLNASDSFSASNFPTEYREFRKILGRYTNVIAIFAGHIHKWAGSYEFDAQAGLNGNNSNAKVVALNSNGGAGRTVPVFFGGGAEYSTYMRVDFEPSKFTVQVVNSRNGRVDTVGMPVEVTH